MVSAIINSYRLKQVKTQKQLTESLIPSNSYGLIL